MTEHEKYQEHIRHIPKLIEKIIEEKAYKPDYDALTTQLLEEKVSYDTVIGALKQIAESDWFKE